MAYDIGKIQRIYLGVQGENASKPLEFNMKPWLDEYPDGSVSIYHLRNGQEESYPVAAVLDREDGILNWTPNIVDTQYKGKGLCQFRLTQSGIVRKSKNIPTEVDPALPGTMSEEIPPAIEPYVELIEEYKNAAELAAEDAEDAQEAAEAAQEAAETAQAAAETAQAAAETAQAVAELAQGAAEDAQVAAETAQDAAETAQAAAELAQGAAEDAQVAAQDAALSAATSAEGAGASASDAALSAISAVNAANAADGNAAAAEASATAAEEAKDKAEEARDVILGMTAEAETLDAGEDATASYDPETGIMTFGIPRGLKGDTGGTGPQGPAGSDAPQIDDTVASPTNPWSGKKVSDELGLVNQAILDLDTVKADKIALKEANRRIHLLEEAALGHLYTDESVTETGYQQTVPSGSLSNAVLGMWGGHSEVVEGEIVSANTNDIMVTGRNLVNINDIEGGATEKTYDFILPIPVTSRMWIRCERSADYVESSDAWKIRLNYDDGSYGYYGTQNSMSKLIEVNHKKITGIYVRSTGISEGKIQKIGLYYSATEVPFEPYKELNHAIPASVLSQYPLRSAGSVYDTITYEPQTVDGVTVPLWKHHKRIKPVDLGTLGWSYNAISEHERFLVTMQDIKPVASNDTIANILCVPYNVDTANNTYRHSTDKIIAVTTANQLSVYDSQYSDITSFLSAMTGVTLYYELATEVVTDITDLMQNWDGILEVEEGGTVTFKQEGDTIFAVPNTVNYLVKTTQGGV